MLKQIRYLSPPSGVLEVRKENIIKALNVPEDEADQYLIEIIQTLTERCLSICSPSGCYAIFDHPRFDIKTGEMFIAEYCFKLGRMVASELAKSSGVAFFIGTCGGEVEKFSKQLLKGGELLDGLIADLIGSEITEEIAGFIHLEIARRMASEGLNTTNRYSPGYCGWPVSDQQKLFALMPGTNCGVLLNQASLMVPIKSVSGVVGIGKNVKNKGYRCSRCKTENCLYRSRK